MTMEKDYYKILGVQKNASQDEIKKAYRKLSLEFHPDRNSDDNAIDRMKEINEANEVLSDEKKRADYDGGGQQRNPGFNRQWSRVVQKGRDVQKIVYVELKSLLHNQTIVEKVQREDRCNVCEGRGIKSGATPKTCATCNGMGNTNRRMNMGNQFINITQS